jgi:hypothetical protein
VRVATGKHNIKVIAKGGKVPVYDKQVSVAGGMTTDVKIAGSAHQKSSKKTKKHREPVFTKSGMPVTLLSGIITGGTGVAFLGLGVAFAIKSVSDDKTANSLDPSDPSDIEAINDYNERIVPLNNAMTITGFAVGGAAIIAGTVLIIIGIKDKKYRDSKNKKVSIYPSPTGLTLSF